MLGALYVSAASAVCAFIAMVGGVVLSDMLIGAVLGCPKNGPVPLHHTIINLGFAAIFAVCGGIVVRLVATILGREHEHMAVLGLVVLMTIMNGVCLYSESRAKSDAAAKKKDDDAADAHPQLPKWYTLALALISINGILFGAYSVYPW